MKYTLLLIFSLSFGCKDSFDREANRYRIESLLAEVKGDDNIQEASVTDIGVLYLAVVNDGTDKSAMATRYCRIAKEGGYEFVSMVKVVDAASAQFQEGAVIGTELGKSHCE